MSDRADVWKALLKDGPLNLEDLERRVVSVLRENASFAKNTNVDTHLFYSGNVGDIPGWQVANSLIEQSGGTIGSLDTTPIGKVLNDIGASMRNGALEKDFKNQLSLDGVDAKSVDGLVYDSFNPASTSYAKQVEGRVITITSQAEIREKAYAEHEVLPLKDRVLQQGLEKGRITHVNNVEAEVFRPLEAIKDPEERRLAYKEAFDQSAADRLIDARPDAYRGVNPKGHVSGTIAPTTEQIRLMGASSNVVMTPPKNIQDMTRIPGNEFAKVTRAARTSHVNELINDNQLKVNTANAHKDLKGFDLGVEPKAIGSKTPIDMKDPATIKKIMKAVSEISDPESKAKATQLVAKMSGRNVTPLAKTSSVQKSNAPQSKTAKRTVTQSRIVRQANRREIERGD